MLSIAVSVFFFNMAPKLRHTIFLNNGIKKKKCDIGGSGDGEGARKKKWERDLNVAQKAESII